MTKTKFHNHTFVAEGVAWDSKLEYRRWLFLKSLEAEGIVSNLCRQVEFEIIPSQTVVIRKELKTKVKYITRTVEKPARYTADFVYDYKQDSKSPVIRIIEDTKSFITRRQTDYVLRRKLMRLNGMPISEVSKPNEPVIVPIVSAPAQ